MMNRTVAPLNGFGNDSLTVINLSTDDALIVSVSYLVFAVIGTICNLLTLMLIPRLKNLHNDIHWLFLNLSVIDLTCTIPLLVWISWSLKSQDNVPFMDSLCNIISFITMMSFSATLFTLAVASIEGLTSFLVVYYVQMNTKRFSTRLTNIAIWIMAILISLPNFVMHRHPSSSLQHCLLLPFGNLVSPLDRIYFVVSIVSLYTVLLITTLYCYSKAFIIMRTRIRSAERTQSLGIIDSRRRSKQSHIFALFTLTMFFILTTAPWMILISYLTFTNLTMQVINNHFSVHDWILAHLFRLLYISTCSGIPIMYSLVNPLLKRSFLTCMGSNCCCCCESEIHKDNALDNLFEELPLTQKEEEISGVE
ncbi:Neuromedin-U receptor 1 [Trichoplax sp. H2]|nr:Neuromedin-U receptor 1 [Trichoplax sp. H2]|eukprot:RDD38743.1 Neuromedin-U receptor 1 [Trichoplax sp. H2]